jgi:hypothetical protein
MLSVRVVKRVQVSTGHYYPNRAPLQPVLFQKLPPGAVKPAGWLLGQLRLQLNGLNGKWSEISDFLIYDKCGWVDPTKEAWEELPYWLLTIVSSEMQIRFMITRITLFNFSKGNYFSSLSYNSVKVNYSDCRPQNCINFESFTYKSFPTPYCLALINPIFDELSFGINFIIYSI